MIDRTCAAIGAGLLALTCAVLPAYGQQTSQAAQERGIVPFTDQRMPIALTEVERAFIRREMRGFLASLQEILEASAAGDHAQVAAAGRRSGMGGPEQEHIPKSLAPKLPMEFKQLGLATHRAFDQIAAGAQGGDATRVPKQVGELMRNCVACHSTWRIVGDGER